MWAIAEAEDLTVRYCSNVASARALAFIIFIILSVSIVSNWKREHSFSSLKNLHLIRLYQEIVKP